LFCGPKGPDYECESMSSKVNGRQRGRLDLTVEAVIWDNREYQELFTEDELKIIKKRLVDYNYVSK
jgi:hypothetical protein